MSEPTNYNKMFEKEPETIEDLIPNPWEEDENVPVPGEVVEESVEEFVETITMEPEVVAEPEEVDEPAAEVDDIHAEPEPKRVRVDIDAVAKLKLRATPAKDGEVIERLRTGTILKVLDEANPEWLFVSVEDATNPQVGYVMRLYVVEV